MANGAIELFSQHLSTYKCVPSRTPETGKHSFNHSGSCSPFCLLLRHSGVEGGGGRLGRGLGGVAGRRGGLRELGRRLGEAGRCRAGLLRGLWVAGWGLGQGGVGPRDGGDSALQRASLGTRTWQGGAARKGGAPRKRGAALGVGRGRLLRYRLVPGYHLLQPVLLVSAFPRPIALLAVQTLRVGIRGEKVFNLKMKYSKAN